MTEHASNFQPFNVMDVFDLNPFDDKDEEKIPLIIPLIALIFGYMAYKKKIKIPLPNEK